MAESKSDLWRSLKEEGWKPPASKAYVNYTTDELELELGTFIAQKMVAETLGEPMETSTDEDQPYSEPESKESSPAQPEETIEWLSGLDSAPILPPVTVAPRTPAPAPEPVTQGQPAPFLAAYPDVPRTDVPDKIAGLRLRTHGRDDPLRIDSKGRVWFQDEIRKPAIATPRARSVLTSIGRGVKTVVNRNKLGLVEESFEVQGDQGRDKQVKITLPAWQVGIYGDPGLPFRVHVYNNIRAFDRLDVVGYFGGNSDYVPSTVKIQYVGGELCYDINSVRDTLERIYRESVLKIGSLK